MANPVLGNSLCSDRFFLGQDFAVRIVVQPVYFCFGAKPATSKFATKQRKKPWILSFFTKLKRLQFFRNFKDEHSPSEFYYPEDLETFDVETETRITESQEAIDDFINQQKSPNTNKKTATDMNTLLRTWKLMVWKMRKLKAFLHPSLTTFCRNFFWTHPRKMENSTRQQQFPVFSAVYSNT